MIFGSWHKVSVSGGLTKRREFLQWWLIVSWDIKISSFYWIRPLTGSGVDWVRGSVNSFSFMTISHPRFIIVVFFKNCSSKFGEFSKFLFFFFVVRELDPPSQIQLTLICIFHPYLVPESLWPLFSLPHNIKPGSHSRGLEQLSFVTNLIFKMRRRKRDPKTSSNLYFPIRLSISDVFPMQAT